MKTILTVILFILLAGCTKQVDRLLGNGNTDSAEQQKSKYPYLYPKDNSFTPDFCNKYKDVCHDLKVPGY